MRIEHITYARMPTEKAHGIQMHKMCEAFAALGHEVTLTVPTLRNPIKEDVPTYYAGKTSYTTVYLRMPDLIFLAPLFGFWAHRLNVFVFMLRLLFHRPEHGTLIITRTPEMAWLYKLRGYTVVYELIDWPESWIGMYMFLLRRVDLITCISEGLEAELQDRDFTRTLIARSAVDVEDFVINVQKNEVRTKLGLPLDKKIVMYIGALDAWKGVESLFAASLVLPDDYQIVIIGGSDAKLEKYQAKFPKVTFLGRRPYSELPQNQRAADLLVIPNIPGNAESEKYTSPIKLFAHLLSGVPIVISRLPSMEMVVNDNQVFFFTAGDTEDLCNILTTINPADPAVSEITDQALAYGKKFSWQERAQSILARLKTDNAINY